MTISDLAPATAPEGVAQRIHPRPALGRPEAPAVAVVRNSLNAAGTTSDPKIGEAVCRLLHETGVEAERRWEPRVLYVRPVWVLYEHLDRPGPQGEGICFAMTTDISSGGIGIVTWNRIPARFVQVRFPEVGFACELRWSSSFDEMIYRYGLRFLNILAESE